MDGSDDGGGNGRYVGNMPCHPTGMAKRSFLPISEKRRPTLGHSARMKFRFKPEYVAFISLRVHAKPSKSHQSRPELA